MATKRNSVCLILEDESIGTPPVPLVPADVVPVASTVTTPLKRAATAPSTTSAACQPAKWWPDEEFTARDQATVRSWTDGIRKWCDEEMIRLKVGTWDEAWRTEVSSMGKTYNVDDLFARFQSLGHLVLQEHELWCHKRSYLYWLNRSINAATYMEIHLSEMRKAGRDLKKDKTPGLSPDQMKKLDGVRGLVAHFTDQHRQAREIKAKFITVVQRMRETLGMAQC